MQLDITTSVRNVQKFLEESHIDTKTGGKLRLVLEKNDKGQTFVNWRPLGLGERFFSFFGFGNGAFKNIVDFVYTNRIAQDILTTEQHSKLLNKITVYNKAHAGLRSLSRPALNVPREQFKVNFDLLDKNSYSAIEAARNTLSLDPGNIKARVMLIEALAKNGQTKSVEEECKHAFDHSPEALFDYYLLATAVVKHSEAEHLEKECKQAMETGSHNLIPNLFLARLYFEEKKVDQMKEVCGKIARFAPHTGLSEMIHGMWWQANNSPNEAIKWFEKALACCPQDSMLSLLLAGCLLKTPDGYPRAIELFQNAIDLEPDNEIPRVLLLEAYEENEEWIKAIEVCKEIIMRFPNDKSMFRQLEILVGRVPDADLESVLKELTQHISHSWVVYTNLSSQQSHANKLQEANESIKKALELNPLDQDAQECQRTIQHRLATS